MQGSSHKSLSRDAKLAEAETKKNSQCLGDVLTSANPVLDDTSDPSSYLQAPASIRRSHLNTDDDSRLASTLELTDSNRVYTSIDDSVTYPSRRLQEHPRLQPEATFAHTMDADSHGSPSSLDPLHRNCAASTDVLVVGQTAAQTKSSGSVMKPRGLTLSAFRRPENTIRLTQADPLRRLELEYDLHGACARGVLGHGAFSTVRLAVRLSDGVQVAVKSIAKHEALRSRRLRHVQGVTLRGHYLEEWEILRRLQNHPYVINLLDVFETLEEIQLVTEYCPGGELFDAIQKKQRKNRRSGSSSSSSEAQAAQITSQILLALNDIHAAGIVHRDVKPENILLAKPADEESVHVKLCDFGVARPLMRQKTVTDERVVASFAFDNSASSVCVSSDGEASPLTPGNRSRSFSAIGTDYYAAPELTYGSCYDTAVDIYSLGVTLYILLCGFPPVFSACAANVTQEVEDSDDETFEEVLFPDAYWSDISFAAKSLLRRMLHSDPAMRVSAKEALKDPWIQTWVSSSTPNVRIRMPQARVDLDLVRSALNKSLESLRPQSVGESQRPMLSSTIVQQATTLPTRKRGRGYGSSTTILSRRVASRASTTALIALADLYRGVAAPSVIAAAAAAAATSENDSGSIVSTPSISLGSTDAPNCTLAVASSPVAALSF